ncbi:MAG: hypothetical protein ORN49_08700 [Rhodobacteraceae bacterium]|nr:hypothetical protein [Paracoccaceae bacterium]
MRRAERFSFFARTDSCRIVGAPIMITSLQKGMAAATVPMAQASPFPSTVTAALRTLLRLSSDVGFALRVTDREGHVFMLANRAFPSEGADHAILAGIKTLAELSNGSFYRSLKVMIHVARKGVADSSDELLFAALDLLWSLEHEDVSWDAASDRWAMEGKAA